MAAGVPDNIRVLVEAKLAESGLELFDLRFFPAGSRPILRVTIDSAAGVTVGDCEKVSRDLSMLLDVEDFSPGRRYHLEVSSPGIDRPLRTERDFRRVVGRWVVLQMKPVWSGKKTLKGKVLSCGNEMISCEMDGVAVDLPIASIASGKEEIQFK